jgi:RNA polymerase sigma factor (sigma-70 family)
MTDDQIIQMIKNGKNENAFLALYKHFPMIRKMVKSKGGEKEDAEDIFQEALIILFRKVTETDFKLTAKISTYLFSICRYLWKDQLIKRGKFQQFEFELNIDKDEEESLNEIHRTENKLLLADKILNELGDRCRELLILFYNETMKLKDIAAKMGYSSENSAKNQKYKCLEMAKNKLKEAKQLM